jgi:hypothetical protein
MADVEYDIDSDSTNTVDILGLNDIKANLKLELPQPFKTENSSSLDIKPLKADLGTDTHLEIKPLKLELQVDPMKTDNSYTVDLKPTVVDLCLTTNIGKLPNVCIRQPYSHHIGFTLYNVEVWGFTFSGQQETVIEDLPRQPKVMYGDVVPSWSPQRPAPHASAQPPSRQIGGLRVRLGS